jgi:hypothetical protein
VPKYRCTIRHEYVSFVDIEAEDEVEAYDLAEAYIEDGGVGEDGYWSTREADEPELICEYCNEPRSMVFSIPCCQKGRLTDEELPY